MGLAILRSRNDGTKPVCDSMCVCVLVIVYVQNLRTSIVLISHGHVDHVGACIQHARARARCYPRATYYLPADRVDAMQRAKAAFQDLDGPEIPMTIGECL